MSMAGDGHHFDVDDDADDGDDDAYPWNIRLCRWFRFAQLAKGKKSRP